MSTFLETLIFAVSLGSLYALIALGYTMVYGILKLINFAHSDVVTLGAWISLTTAGFLLPRMGVNLNEPPFAPWWAPVLVLLISVAICALIGLAIERFAYKPIRRAPRLNALITAMGVSLLLQNVGQLQYTVIDGQNTLSTGKVVESFPAERAVTLDRPITIEDGRQYVLKYTPASATVPIDRRLAAAPGDYPAGQKIPLASSIGRREAQGAGFTLITQSPPLRLPFGKSPEPAPSLLPTVTHAGDPINQNVLFDLQAFAPNVFTKPVKVNLIDVVIVLTAAALMIGLQLLIYHSKLGMAMRAVSFSPDYAALMGIPVNRVISTTFVIGASLAAAAGFLYSQRYPTLPQSADYAWVLLGLKAFIAAVIGGIGNIRGAVVGGFIIAFIEFFGGTYLPAISGYIDVIVFLLLILVLLVRPAGLFGSTVKEKV